MCSYEEMLPQKPNSMISKKCFDGLMMLEQDIPKVDALEQRLDAILEGMKGKICVVNVMTLNYPPISLYICHWECVSEYAYYAI